MNYPPYVTRSFYDEEGKLLDGIGINLKSVVDGLTSPLNPQTWVDYGRNDWRGVFKLDENRMVQISQLRQLRRDNSPVPSTATSVAQRNQGTRTPTTGNLSFSEMRPYRAGHNLNRSLPRSSDTGVRKAGQRKSSAAFSSSEIYIDDQDLSGFFRHKADVKLLKSMEFDVRNIVYTLMEKPLKEPVELHHGDIRGTCQRDRHGLIVVDLPPPPILAPSMLSYTPPRGRSTSSRHGNSDLDLSGRQMHLPFRPHSQIPSVAPHPRFPQAGAPRDSSRGRRSPTHGGERSVH